MHETTRRGACLALILLLAAGTAAAQNTYNEDFTTTSYRSGTTTADWNTGDGRLQFHPFEPSLIGAVDTPSAARGVEVHGDLIYLADGYAGLQIIDVSDGANPLVIGTYNTPGYSYQVRVQGDTAYVADHSGGLQVLDVSDPAAPSLLGTYATGGVALGLSVAGDHAYVGCGDGGLYLVDVSDPAAPTLAAAMTTEFATPRASVVDGNLLYVALGDQGLGIVDVTDPANPAVISILDTSGYVNAVAARGNWVYLSADGHGLVVCSVGNPAAPFVARNHTVSGNVRDVFVHGTRVYLSNDAAGVHVFDVASPNSVHLEWTHDSAGHVYAATATANRLYLADFGAGLAVLDVAEVLVPSPVRQVVAPGTVIGVNSHGDRAYLALGSVGFAVASIVNPAHPYVYSTRINPAGYVRKVAGAGDHAYVAAGTGGLLVYDLRSTSSPVLVGQYVPSTDVLDVSVQGDLACIGLETAGVRMMDISDPAAPVFIGSWISNSVYDVELVGDHFWALSETSLWAVDVSTPTAPVLAGEIDLGTNPYDLEVAGDLVFVGTADGVRIVDATDPTDLVQVGSIAASSAVNLAFTGDHLVFVGSGAYLQFWNVEDPAAPWRVGASATVSTSTYGLAVSGRTVVVGSSYPAQIETFEIFQDQARLADDVGVSMAVDGASRLITAARVNDAGNNGVVDLHVRNTSSDAWAPVQERGAWVHFPNPQTNLYWQAILNYSRGFASSLGGLELEWLNEHANITAVDDVPGDQGGQVRLQWRRSGYDFVGQSGQIVEYAVYRWFDGAGNVTKRAPRLPERAKASPALAQNAAAMAAAGWDYVTSLPVLVTDNYSVVVPTLADSTAAGTAAVDFQVVALTAAPGVHYSSPSVSGYSVDNLEPGAPQAVAAHYRADAVDLSWEEAPETDFRNYRVYRSTDPGFDPAPEHLVHESAAPAWSDPTDDPWLFHYKITAVDFAGNESDAGVPAQPSGTPDAGAVFALEAAAPNPFNPSTTIKYSLGQAGNVRLEVHDTAGRRVATLVDGVREAGAHRAVWDGTDGSGRGVASGVYFYRLTAGRKTAAGRMVLVK